MAEPSPHALKSIGGELGEMLEHDDFWMSAYHCLGFQKESEEEAPPTTREDAEEDAAADSVHVAPAEEEEAAIRSGAQTPSQEPTQPEETEHVEQTARSESGREDEHEEEGKLEEARFENQEEAELATDANIDQPAENEEDSELIASFEEQEEPPADTETNTEPLQENEVVGDDEELKEKEADESHVDETGQEADESHISEIGKEADEAAEGHIDETGQEADEAVEGHIDETDKEADEGHVSETGKEADEGHVSETGKEADEADEGHIVETGKEADEADEGHIVETGKESEEAVDGHVDETGQDTDEAAGDAEIEGEPAHGEMEVEPPHQISVEDAPPERRKSSPVEPHPVHKDPSTMLINVTFCWGTTETTILLPLTTGLPRMRVMMSAVLSSPPDDIDILFNGTPLHESNTLEDIGVDEGESVALEVIRHLPPAPAEEKPRQPTPPHQPKEKDPLVIERSRYRKPYLGGYRHKTTHTEFHNASAQTAPFVKDRTNAPPCNTSATQTYQQRHQRTEAFTTTATQMTRPGIYISNATDRIISLGNYETAEVFKSKQTAKIITIQTYYRSWLAKRYIDTLRKARDMRIQWEEDEQVRKQMEKQDRLRKDLARRMHPRSKEDFELLFSALEKWRRQEELRIFETLEGAERKAALYVLLEQETDLIHAIDRHHLNASDENKQKFIHNLLGQAAAPKQWKNKKGDAVLMDTPFTLRGRELLDIAQSLQMRHLTQDERLDVLLTLKHTVKEHECKLTLEIVALVDREVDLMMRGVKEENLIGLRKRLLTLFLQYAKTPTFNPEVARYLKVPQDASELHQDIHYCRSCGRYLRNTEFQLGSKSTHMGKCKNCIREDNLARSRQDLSTFKNILSDLRRNEENFQDNAQVAFLIEEADIRYLVENVWESMSILSSWGDLADLTLARWRVKEEWSPWNCILLTKDEAEAHYKVPSLQTGYGDMLIHRVKQKHILSKNYFAKLAYMADSVARSKSRDLSLKVGNSSTDRFVGNIRIITKIPPKNTSHGTFGRRSAPGKV